MKRLLPLLLLAAGCANETSLVDVPTCGVETETYVQGSRAVDVLFVVDDSSSMAHEQDRLRESFDEFVGWLAQEDVSYHLGITTTSVTTGVGGFLVGDPAWVDESTPNGLEQFLQNANVGLGGSGVEQGMEAAYKLLAIEMTEETGFLRDDAKLSIVFLSDEDDDSKRSIEEYATFFEQRKGNDPNLLNVHAVAAAAPQECEGVLRAGVRYEELVDRLHGRFTSICEASFAPALETIANDAAGRERVLSRRPDVRTISVTVGGETLAAEAWSFDPGRNAVVFGTAPASGTEVTISYAAACN